VVGSVACNDAGVVIIDVVYIGGVDGCYGVGIAGIHGIVYGGVDGDVVGTYRVGGIGMWCDVLVLVYGIVVDVVIGVM